MRSCYGNIPIHYGVYGKVEGHKVNSFKHDNNVNSTLLSTFAQLYFADRT